MRVELGRKGKIRIKEIQKGERKGKSKEMKTLTEQQNEKLQQGEKE